MAFENITTFLFGSRPHGVIAPDAGGGGLVVDAMVSEVHELSSQITNNEVEDGSQLSDHVRLMPIRLNLEGIVSKSPLTIFSSAFNTGLSYAAATVGASQGAVAAGSALIGAGLEGAPALGTAIFGGKAAGTKSLSSLVLKSREPSDVWSFFNQLWELRIPFSVNTGLKSYQNMIIASLSVNRSSQVGQSVKFNMSLQQVQLASTLIIKVPEFKVKSDAAHSAASEVSAGKQSSTDSSDNASIAYRTVYGGG